MFRRRSTTSDSTDASAYSRRAAVADSIWAAQDRVRSGSSAGLGKVVAGADHALERASFPLQKRVLWPLADRTTAIGAPVRALSTGALVLLAAAAGVAGLVWAAPDGPHNASQTTAVATASSPAATAKAPADEPGQPTLQGAAPVFKPAKGRVAAEEADPAKAIVKSSPSPASASTSAATDSAATASSAADGAAAQIAPVDGPPAGPAAISVARDFSDAFVVYETGGSEAQVRETFAATATPALAKALLRRPPRLPANLEVPKAKVVNVVPGPSHDRVYPVSVSLLRVGLTSELRLEMEQHKGDGWRVTNVLG